MERDFDLQTARARVEQFLSKRRLRQELVAFGKHIVTVCCVIKDENDDYQDFGYGKGSIEAAYVGALYEATEHFLTQNNNIGSDTKSLVQFPLSVADQGLNSSYIFDHMANQKCSTPCLRYKSLNSPTDRVVYLPIGFSNPKYVDMIVSDPNGRGSDTYDYSTIDRYCTNSGMAIGGTASEAIIHGLTEAIERETLSKLLVQCFLYRDLRNLKKISPHTLSRDHTILLRHAVAELGSAVSVFWMVNDLGVPVFAAQRADLKQARQFGGFGCSLSASHAFERSLHELVQCFHAGTFFYPEAYEKHTETVTTKLKRHSFHMDCFNLNLEAAWSGCGGKEVDFSEISQAPIPTDTNSYLAELLEKCDSCDLRVFSSEVHSDQSGLALWHTFIDGYDPFFCATEGCLVFPYELHQQISALQ
ncbi:MAG: YcaO-like family protein [Paracoccaceae bacterium]